VFETSLNGPGFSITLCNLTTAAKESNTSVSELMDLLGAETKAPAWPNVLSNTSTKAVRKEIPIVDIEKETEISPNEEIKGERIIIRGLGNMLKLGSSRSKASGCNNKTNL